MVLVDVCTRFVLLDALKNKNALTVAKALVNRFLKLVFPKYSSLTMAKSTTTDF